MYKNNLSYHIITGVVSNVFMCRHEKSLLNTFPFNTQADPNEHHHHHDDHQVGLDHQIIITIIRLAFKIMAQAKTRFLNNFFFFFGGGGGGGSDTCQIYKKQY